MNSFRDVLDLWPSTPDLAEEIGYPERRISKWRARDSVPSYAWVALVTAARRHGFAVSYEQLAAIAARGVEAA